MDFIIIGGSPGNGKTTVASTLHKKMGMPWFEFGWIPEFTKLNPNTNISQREEEQLSFENLISVCKNYKRHQFKNVILTDLDDVRMLDIPIVFNDSKYVIITLYSEDNDIIKDRILNRKNGNEYRNYEESIKTNNLILNRKLLPNEYRIRSDSHTTEDIADKIIYIISHHNPNKIYDINDYKSEDYFTYVKCKSEFLFENRNGI